MGRLSSLTSARLGACVLGSGAVRGRRLRPDRSVQGQGRRRQNKPVEGATVVMESKEMNRKLTTKTDSRGEYTQFLPPGEYMVTVSKDNLRQTQVTAVSLDERELNFTLKPGGGGGGGTMSEADKKKLEAERAAVKAAFTRRRDAQQRRQVRRGDREVQRGASSSCPKCVECYINIGSIHMRKKDYAAGRGGLQEGDRAAARRRPSRTWGWPTSTTRRRSSTGRWKRARRRRSCWRGGAAGGAAGGGASADACSTRASSPGTPARSPEAKKLFEQAVEADPEATPTRTTGSGMANVNQGKLPEGVKSFEEYLKLAPTGQYAEQAQGHARGDQEVAWLDLDSRRSCRSQSISLTSAPHREPPRRVRARPGATSRSSPFRRRSAPTRARGLGRRPARLRREQGPGRPAEDRRNRRYRDTGGTSSATCSRTRRRRRPPAFDCIHSVDSVDLLRAARRRGGRTAGGTAARRCSSRSTSRAKPRSSARRPTRPAHRRTPRWRPARSGWSG